MLSGHALSLRKRLSATKRRRHQHLAGWCPGCPSAPGLELLCNTQVKPPLPAQPLCRTPFSPPGRAAGAEPGRRGPAEPLPAESGGTCGRAPLLQRRARGLETRWRRQRLGRVWVGEPGDALTAWGAAGEAAAGPARGGGVQGVSGQRLCHRLSPFKTETAPERLPLPSLVPLSVGRTLPALPRSSGSHPCFTAQAGTRVKQLSKLKAELEQCSWLFIGAFAIARKDAFPSPLCVHLKRRCLGPAVAL